VNAMNERTIQDNMAFKTMPRPARIPKRVQRPRVPSKFEIWAWSPVISFQVGLTMSYLAMIYFGVSAFIAEVPTFRVTAPDGWTIWWASALVIGGVLASIGSVSRFKWFERAELVGSILITLTIGSYASIMLFLAYALGDIDRAAGGAGYIALLMGPLVRMLWLASQSLRK